jgi:hypothetical protein
LAFAVSTTKSRSAPPNQALDRRGRGFLSEWSFILRSTRFQSPQTYRRQGAEPCHAYLSEYTIIV